MGDKMIVDLLNGVNIIDEGFNKYGIFKNTNNIRLLKELSNKYNCNSYCIACSGYYLGVLNIQHEFIYLKDKSPIEIKEHNNKLKLLSDDSPRWVFQEVEYKLNILKNEFRFYEIFDFMNVDQFDFTLHPQEFHSIENIFYKYVNKYFSVLTWKNDQRPNAIKIKKIQNTKPILARDTLIIDFSNEALSNVFLDFSINEHVYTKYSAKIDKQKKRHIVIDKILGYVFGVSCNISKTSDDNLFCQVEVEYWSKIVNKNDFSVIENQQEMTSVHFKLINGIMNFMTNYNVNFNNLQLTKNVWLRKINLCQKS